MNDITRLDNKIFFNHENKSQDTKNQHEYLRLNSQEYSKELLKKNNLDEAIITYQKAINFKSLTNTSEGGINSIFLVLGEVIIIIALRQKQLCRAISFFQEAIEEYCYKEWSYFHLGNLFTKHNKFKEAISCYEKSIEIKPEFYLSLIALGEVFLKKGNQNKAFKCGIKIISNPLYLKDKNLRRNKIIIKLITNHSNSNKSKKALKNVIRLIENDDHNQDSKINTYYNIGENLRNQNKYSEAIDFYQKSIYYSLQKSNPEFINNYWNIGKLYKPDFLVIGFAKSGTTAFDNYLSQHSQVLPAVKKEPHYLKWLANKTKYIDKQNWSLPSLEKDLYLAHFASRPEGNHFITGEASTSNIFPGVEKIVASWFPKIKLIFMLREPVRRSISHYEHLLRNETQTASFEEVINSELEKLEGMSDPAQTVVDSIKETGGRIKGINIVTSLYVYHLQRWMEMFPKEQFLILTNEDLAQYPEKTMKQAFDFLEIPQCYSIQYQPKNVGSYPLMDTNILSRLSNFYKPHNQRLEELLGRKFNWD